ncbi:MAG: hypothetical protein CVU00_04210 [Bacteroidetes bacterium HGW-Bacteroidetes-17]|jgi:hypothetical protein|nr:MAG: hypothetical protein CVU00_04210 [Bacteroidetes bacterium HGW-Bacteroidetes-17]
MLSATTKYYRVFFVIPIAVLLFLSSCKKDKFTDIPTGQALSFSNDSIVFDTVFTTIGSITKQLKVYNNSANKVLIKSIELAGGEASAYRLNIDGVAALKIEDIELDGGDSLYIFIKVLIDPNNINSPFVVSDQLRFNTDLNFQIISLVAWGQNANYIIANQNIPGLPPFRIVAPENSKVQWKSTRPYLIYGHAVVDSGAVLQIDKGAKIHFHNNSGLWVYKGGSIKVNGTLEDPVIFAGDRLDEDYRDLPGQWDRILINEGSVNNEINYAIIKNGFIGIQAETLDNPMGNSLILKNTRISNMSGVGILARNYQIAASNNLVTNCGNYLLSLTMGGKYSFIHSTFANYWTSTVRQTPSLYLNNYLKDEEGNISVHEFEASFGNCIIDGRENDELLIDFVNASNPILKFDHNSLKTQLNILNDDRFIQCITNPDSLFFDLQNLNFQLRNLSPAIDKGSTFIATQAPFDILGIQRTENPDLGVFEFKIQN